MDGWNRLYAVEKALIIFAAGAVAIGLLGGPRALEVRNQSLNSKGISLLKTIEVGVEAYQKEHGVYPPGNGTGSRAVCSALLTRPRRGCGFIGPPIPPPFFVNPIDGQEEIKYQCPGIHNPGGFDLWCSDADGNPSGIRNWR